MCIFIRNYSAIVCPLTHLTRKGINFEFGPKEIEAQERLKHAIVTSPAIRSLDYESDVMVYLSVDTSYIAIGYIIAQTDPDNLKIHHPSCFGSMLLNPREAKYSQPKLELYGLFRSLRAACLWIIRVRNLVVKIDAKYIKGMLNNPDIQPNVTINRWIAGILLFDFTLKHVPGATHGPNGLSRWPAQPDDEPNPPDDFKDWIDKSYGFMHMINPHSVCHGAGRALLLYTLASTYNQQLSPPPSTIHSAAEQEPAYIFSNKAATTLDFTPLPIDTDTIFIP